MNIRERLEAEHSKTLTLAIVKYIGTDKARFKELMTVFFNGPYRLTQRAAWPMSYVLIAEPKLLTSYYPRLIKMLNESGHHPSIHRNILRVFQEMEIPEKYRGAVVDACFKNILNETVPAAIRAFSITTACNICKDYPELKNELIIVLNELNQLPQKAAIKQRTKLALKVLQK
jgi:hypothetical protein